MEVGGAKGLRGLARRVVTLLIAFSLLSPFDKDDQPSAASTVNKASTVTKRFSTYSQSPPDTPSLREQAFYVSHGPDPGLSISQRLFWDGSEMFFLLS